MNHLLMTYFIYSLTDTRTETLGTLVLFDSSLSPTTSVTKTLFQTVLFVKKKRVDVHKVFTWDLLQVKGLGS